MPYKIPKNRTTVKTIKMKNGILTGEADNQGNMYWFKDGKYITPYQMESYKYYDPSIKGYRKLGNRAKISVSSGTVDFNDVYNPVYTPNLDRLYSEAARKRKEKNVLKQEQAIPLQNQDWITLRTKGKMNLTDIPMNMLDSIAVNAGRSGTDFWTDMGLVGKESTFYGLSKALGRPYNPSMAPVNVHALTNNHAWLNSPEDDYVAAVNKILYPDPFKETLTDAKKVEAENNVKYATEHGLIKGNTPQYSDYILADAFKRYQTNPAGYNPGQKSYVPMLNGIRQELQGEKQLQNYWNTRGKQEYAIGQKEGMAYGGSLKGRTWDKLSMAEKADVMKLAIEGGVYDLDSIRSGYNEFAEGGSIHIKPENRGKFTALKERTGHSATWFKEHGTPAQKKMATFALNSRHWKHGLGGNLFEDGGRKLEYHPEGDYYYGGIPFKVTVTGKNKKKKRPYWVSPKGAGNTALTIGDLNKAYTAATAGLLPNPISAGINLSQGKVLNALEDMWLYNSAHSEDPNVNYGVVGFSAPEGSLFSSISKASKATPKQWTAAQDAAIARGDMAEAQRLRDLHFKISAPKTEVVDINGNPQLVVHKTPETFTVFDNNRSIGKLNWFATPNAYGENGVFATGAGKNPRTMKLYVNMRNAHKPTIDEGIEPAYINQGEDGLLGIVDKDMTNYFKSSRDAGEGFMMSGGVDNPNALKSADVVTYDNNGVRIPLGKRDNFNINDIRYGLLPFGIGLTGYGLLNNQEAFGGNIKKRKR